MRRRTARLATYLVVAALGGLLAALTQPAHAADPAPTITTSGTGSSTGGATTGEVGERIIFEVRGFRASRVQVELCGALGISSSAHCDSARGGMIVTDPTGAGEVTIELGSPPGGCPCRVRAVGLDTDESAVVPFPVVGAEVNPGAAPPEAAPPRPPATAAVSAAVVDPTWREKAETWLGLRNRHRVQVAVRNTSTRPLRGRELSVWIGRESATLTSQPPMVARGVPALPPGEEWTTTVDLAAPGLLPIGRYVIVGEVSANGAGAASGSAAANGAAGAGAASGEFGTNVSTMPAALIVVAVALLSTKGVSLTRRFGAWRDRSRGRPERATGAPWLVGTAVAAILVAGGLWVRTAWVDYADRLTAQAAQVDLMADFELVGADPDEGPAPERRPGDLVALIRLPTGASWAVVEGVTPEQLARGPGHYPGTAWPGEIGNSVIAGHSGLPDAPFDELAGLSRGDTLDLETPERTWSYVIDDIREVPATATSVLLPVRDQPGADPTQAQLTLITCSYEQGVISGRWIVEATLDGPPASQEAAA